MGNYSFAKRRPLWDIRSLQLVRESITTRYAQTAIPTEVQGIHIYIPISQISIGTYITCQSSLVQGTSLLSLLYSQDLNDIQNAQQYGLVALEALRTAKVHSQHFYWFGILYKWIRLLKLFVWGKKYSLLPKSAQASLNRMALSSVRQRERHKVLMHGDLHAGNLIVDAENKKLAIIDTELMGLGKAVTDFAHLWIGYYFAGAALGKSFYQAYKKQNYQAICDVFDKELRTEIALKSYFMVIAAKKNTNLALENLSNGLLRDMISFNNFEEFLSSVHS